MQKYYGDYEFSDCNGKSITLNAEGRDEEEAIEGFKQFIQKEK